MKNILRAFALVLLYSATVHAQGAVYLAGPFNSAGLLYVCAAPATTTPCGSPVSIFSDSALSISLTDPFPMQTGATLLFWVTPGQYTIQFPATGYSAIVTIGGASSGG